MAVLNWAVRSKDERVCPVLEGNPVKGLRKPTEKTPTRVVPAEDEYRTLLTVSQEVDWWCRIAPEHAHETGHRIGAIRKLP